MDTLKLVKEFDFDANNEMDQRKVFLIMISAITLDMDFTVTHDGENQLLIVRIYAKPKE